MSSQKKRTLCVFCVLILTLCLLAYVAEQQGTSSAAAQLGSVQKSISSGGTIRLATDSPSQGVVVPKNNETVLSKVTSWLQQAKPRKGKIPKSEPLGESAGYFGPAILYIDTTDQHQIAIAPAYYTVSEMSDQGKVYTNRYIKNALKLEYDKQVSYIQSSDIYNWLKNDKWQAECEIK